MTAAASPEEIKDMLDEAMSKPEMPFGPLGELWALLCLLVEGADEASGPAFDALDTLSLHPGLSKQQLFTALYRNPFIPTRNPVWTVYALADPRLGLKVREWQARWIKKGWATEADL